MELLEEPFLYFRRTISAWSEVPLFEMPHHRAQQLESLTLPQFKNRIFRWCYLKNRQSRNVRSLVHAMTLLDFAKKWDDRYLQNHLPDCTVPKSTQEYKRGNWRRPAARAWQHDCPQMMLYLWFLQLALYEQTFHVTERDMSKYILVHTVSQTMDTCTPSCVMQSILTH